MKNLYTYLKPYRKRMALGLSIKVIGTVVELFLPLIMGYMIDVVAPTEKVWVLVLWGLGMLFLAVTAFVTNVIANRMASKVAKDTTYLLRNDLFAKTLSLSSRQVDEVSLPSLVSRLSNDTYNVHQMIWMMQRLGVRAPVLLIGGVALTFTIDPILALILLVTVPILTLIVIVVSKKGIRLYTDLQKSSDQMVRKVRDDYTGIRVIKALSKGDYEKQTFRQINHQVMKNEVKAGRTMGLTNPLMNAILNLGMAAVIFVGAYRVYDGHTMPGDLLSFTSYFTIILNAVISVGRIFVILSKGSASSKRISTILNLPTELLPVPSTTSVVDSYFIRFDHVSFSYQSFLALNDVSFAIKKGESLGIIGATGSGKSTLISLLLRFYDVDQGQIFIDGKDVRSYTEEELRSKIGVVFQNDFLMASSIYDNIDFKRNLDLEQIKTAARYAKADDFIMEHDGYQAQLTSKGSNFSGGQKQRLLIARALAANPEILILDDSSSALDYKTDAMLRKTLLDHFKDTTIVLIAQRISSVRFADHILVLDQGRIVGFGRDEELMKNCPTYQQIYASQHQKRQKEGQTDE